MGRRPQPPPVSQQAIPILQDGPLYHQLLLTSVDHLESDDDVTAVTFEQPQQLLRDEDHEILVLARQWLLLPDDDEDDDSLLSKSNDSPPLPTNTKSLSYKTKILWKTLRHAASLQDQLHTLQAYKSTLLQSSTTTTTTCEDDHKLLIIIMKTTFRIMLEWSFSYQTPHALRKALQSNLVTMARVIFPTLAHNEEEEEDVVHDLYRKVIRSMIVLRIPPPSTTATIQQQQSYNNNACWSQPLCSLSEVMSFTETRSIVAQDGTLATDVLAYLIQYHQRHQLPAMFDHHKTDPNIVHSLSSSIATTTTTPFHTAKNQYNTNHSTISMVDPAFTHALQQGIQMAGIVQSLLLPFCTLEDGKDDTAAAKDRPPPSPQQQPSHFCTLVHDVQMILEQLLSCCSNVVTSSEGLAVVGIAYGRTCLESWMNTTTTTSRSSDATGPFSSLFYHHVAQCACTKLQDMLLSDTKWSSHVLLAVVQGFAATLPLPVLAYNTTTAPPTPTAPTTSMSSSLSHDRPSVFLLDLLARFCLQQVRSAPDTSVRLTALKGLNTLASRCSSTLLLVTTTTTDACWSLKKDNVMYQYIPILVDDAMQVVLQAWENPSGRQVASYVPVLFQSLISLLQQWEGVTTTTTTSIKSEIPIPNGGGNSSKKSLVLQDLVRRVLTLPSNRKGRYLALEALLPLIPTPQLLEWLSGGDSDRPTRECIPKTTRHDDDTPLMESLLHGIADGGHGAGAIAELWAKLIVRLLVHEQQQQLLLLLPADGNDPNPALPSSVLTPKRPNRKERKKMSQGKTTATGM
jgi:hypothetical protein